MQLWRAIGHRWAPVPGILGFCAPECSSGAVSREMKSTRFLKCPSTTNHGTFQIISAVLCGESKDMDRAVID